MAEGRSRGRWKSRKDNEGTTEEGSLVVEEMLITRRGMSMVVSAIGGKSWGSRAFTVVKGGFVNGVKGLGGEGRRKSIGGWGMHRVEAEIASFSRVSEAGCTRPE